MPYRVRFAALPSTVFLALLFSCGPTTPPTPTPRVEAPPPPAAEAVVDYLDGSVQSDSGQGWKDLTVGDRVGPGTTLRTGRASVLELKAGDLATLRLGAETILKWEALVLASDRKRSQVELLAGQVLNKVAKLVGNDSYLVRTRTAALAVRGTQFLVRVTTDSSVLAVKEGTVALLPPSFDPVRWQAGGTEQAAALEKRLLASSDAISANQRTEIGADDLAARGLVLETLAKELPDDPEALIKAFQAAAAKKGTVEPLRPVDKQDLQPLDAMPLGDVVEVSAPVSSPGSPPPNQPSPVDRRLTLTPGHAVTAAVAWPGGFSVSDGQGNLKAFNSAGKPLWSATMPAVSNASVSPVFDGGDLVWTADNAVVILDAKTGLVKRTLTLDATTSGVFGKRALPLGSSLYLGASDGVAVFDRTSGSRTGTLGFSEGTDMTPALVGGQVLVVGRTGTLYSFDPQSSAPSLKVATGANQPVATAPVADAKRVWFADRKGQVFAVDRSGQVTWSVSVGTGVFDQPATDGKSLFVIAKGSLHALHLDTGTEVFPPRSASTAVLIAAGRLWVGDGDRALALDPATGATVWSFSGSASVSSVPILVGAEVGFPMEDGTIVLVDPKRL